MSDLAKGLSSIQQKLKAPKNQRNTFGNYNYRSCEDILEAVKPLLDDLILTLNDEICLIGERYYIRATVTLSDGENSISATAYAREGENRKGMDDSQLTGACSSYARKYALNGLFCIDDEKDADTKDNTHSEKKAPPPAEKKAEKEIVDDGEEGLSVKEKLDIGLRKYCTDNEGLIDMNLYKSVLREITAFGENKGIDDINHPKFSEKWQKTAYGKLKEKLGDK
jgi:hypothetical protein